MAKLKNVNELKFTKIMSNKKGKAMSNLPIHYIQAMEELQEENNKLRLELQGLKTKVNVALGSVSKSLPDGDDIWCKASEMSRDNFADWYDNL